MRTIKDWCTYIHAVAKGKGWWETERNVPEQLALMHSEISEALEEYRKGNKLDYVYYGYVEEQRQWSKPEGFAIELADCVIRIMDTCEAYGIDLEEMIKVKMEYNETRSYRHGRKKC